MKAGTVRAELDRCRRCDAAIVHGWTTPPASSEVRAEPVPLDPAGELLALLDGRHTYDLMRIAMHNELVHRDPFRIKHRKWPVLATHRCPGLIHAAAIPAPPPQTETEYPDQPPF